MFFKSISYLILKNKFQMNNHFKIWNYVNILFLFYTRIADSIIGTYSEAIILERLSVCF
jgi:hypothetical protein